MSFKSNKNRIPIVFCTDSNHAHLCGIAINSIVINSYISKKTNLQIVEKSPLFSYKWKVSKTKTVWMSHGDHVSKLPKNFKLLASSENIEYSIAGDTKKNYYGIQFHPEVSHTQDGNEILKNFSLKICKIKTFWTISNYKNLILEDIKQKVGDAKVILGLSGGVDSAVAAALISKSIGKKVISYLDHWTNYKQRFIRNNKLYLPDEIWIKGPSSPMGKPLHKARINPKTFTVPDTKNVREI